MWSTLAGLAATVPRLRIGSMVSCNTYRHPAVLAKIAATVDNISGGRLVLGLGAGWQENEHAAYGLDLHTLGERMQRMEEACQVIKTLFTNRRSNYAGRYYQLAHAPLEPKPVQNPLPLLIGGGGEKVTLRVTAQYADEWHVWGDVATFEHKTAVLDQHCESSVVTPLKLRARPARWCISVMIQKRWNVSRANRRTTSRSLVVFNSWSIPWGATRKPAVTSFCYRISTWRRVTRSSMSSIGFIPRLCANFSETATVRSGDYQTSTHVHDLPSHVSIAATAKKTHRLGDFHVPWRADRAEFLVGLCSRDRWLSPWACRLSPVLRR